MALQSVIQRNKKIPYTWNNAFIYDNRDNKYTDVFIDFSYPTTTKIIALIFLPTQALREDLPQIG